MLPVFNPISKITLVYELPWGWGKMGVPAKRNNDPWILIH
jgi:hypothetical protein